MKRMCVLFSLLLLCCLSTSRGQTQTINQYWESATDAGGGNQAVSYKVDYYMPYVVMGGGGESNIRLEYYWYQDGVWSGVNWYQPSGTHHTWGGPGNWTASWGWSGNVIDEIHPAKPANATWVMWYWHIDSTIYWPTNNSSNDTWTSQQFSYQYP